MKVGIIGTGYVGLPTGVGLAELGHDVICIDVIQEKVDALKAGKITLFEDGLEELFHKNAASGKLRFTSDMKEGVENADVAPCADMSLDSVYAPFQKLDGQRFINISELGVNDKASSQISRAGWQVSLGKMTVDEAVAAFGSIR